MVAGLVALVPLLPRVLGGGALAHADGFRGAYSWHGLAAEAWRRGDVPGWDPFSFAGAPLLAAAQAAVFHPFRLLTVALPDPLANDVGVALTAALTAVGTALLASRWGAGRAGAALGGVAFTWSGFVVAHQGHQGILVVVSMIPWALLGVDRLAERRTPARAAAAAAPVALAGVGGHPQLFVVLLAVVAGWALVAAALDRARRRAVAVAAGIAVAAGLGLAAVQLAPTLAVLDATDRGVDLPYEVAAEGLPPSHLVLGLFPFLFGSWGGDGPVAAEYRGAIGFAETSFAVGGAVAVLAAVGTVGIRRNRRLLALLPVAAIAGVVALASEGPLGRLVYALPVVGQMRIWARYLVVVDLVIALLAARGTSRLVAGDRERAARTAAGAAVAVVGAAVLVRHAPGVRAYAVDGGDALAALGLPALAATVVALVAGLAGRRLPRRASPALSAGIGLVVVAELWFGFGAWMPWRSSADDATLTRAADRSVAPSYGWPRDAAGGVDRVLFLGTDLALVAYEHPPTAGLRGVHWVNGWDSLAPRTFTDRVGDMAWTGIVQDPSAAWAAGGRLLHLLRVTTVLVDPATAPLPPPGLAGLRGPTELRGGRLLRYEIDPLLPEAYVAGSALLVDAPAAADAPVSPPFGPLGTVAVHEGDACAPCAGAGEAGPAGTAEVVARSPGRLEVAVAAERPGLLVVSAAHFPGWHARVDGRAAPVVRAEGVLLGVPVGPGRHVVTLAYRVPGLGVGVLVSALTGAALLAWVAGRAAAGRSRLRAGR